ncbi:hypothetical protein B9Z19DRAFT_338976 [Tuber borchii]|uniref:Uncharacterized protein n=1 Tax=Tuber borchii TaxID=42251 RepID=A0A2T6ZJ36_TUBBO|nr:hypothetical protein B9Z19DRAFT_338976 [Tuber borchii]
MLFSEKWLFFLWWRAKQGLYAFYLSIFRSGRGKEEKEEKKLYKEEKKKRTCKNLQKENNKTIRETRTSNNKLKFHPHEPNSMEPYKQKLIYPHPAMRENN